MTNAVDPALAQPQGVKPKADRQGLNRQPDRSAFGEALQAAGTSKRNPAEKIPVQSEHRWLAPARLTVPIGNLEKSVTKQPLEILASAELEEMDEPADETRESDGELETKDDAIVVFPPISVSAFHHPAFAARSIGDRNDADPDLSKKQNGDTGLHAGVGKAEGATETPAQNAVGIDRALPAATDSTAPDTAPATLVRNSTTDSDKQPTKAEMTRPDAADAKAATPRPAIFVEQSTTALAPVSTGINLAEKLAAQATLIMAPAKPEMPAQAASPPPIQAHTLKLQLHPAELGIVTASLRFAGEHLSIELQVESAQAHQRLSADSEAIVTTLRGLGYEIDRVTILQPVVGSSASPRPDADPSLAGQSRSDPQSLDTGGSNNGGDRLGRRDRGQGGDDTKQDGPRNAGKPDDRSGGSLYI